MKDLTGVDVASFQGVPGAWATSAGDIDFAAVKLTELNPDGTAYVNPDAAADWAYLKAQGNGRIAYLFGHPGASAADTVEFFVTELAKLGLEHGDAVALDLEVSNGRTPAEVDSWALAVLGELRARLGRTPLLYTFLAFAEAGNCASLGQYPLWMSDPSSPAGHPRIPAPWTTWALHQYSTVGEIDRDIAAYPTLAAMRAALGKTTPHPATTSIPEDPMLVLSGAGADTPVTLPDQAAKVRIGACGDTTISLQFHGHTVKTGIELDWKGGSKEFAIPAGSRMLRIFRPAAGNPDVPVTIAIS
jgi:lysozyme